MKKLFATAASVLVLGLATPAMAQSSSSTIDQIGYSQDATVNQYGAGANNISAIEQGKNIAGSNLNTVTTTQWGSNNIENYSTVKQDGVDNDASVIQSGDGWLNDYNWSLITQTGSENTASVSQSNLSLNNFSTIDQDGAKNLANVTQGGGINVLNNTSIINQNSTGFSLGNTATVNQN